MEKREPPRPNRLSAANWTLKSLVHLGEHFREVRRVSAALPKNELLAVIHDHEYKGLPLVIEGWHKDPRWNAKLLSPDWLTTKYLERMRHSNCRQHHFSDRDLLLVQP
jgi:hypothetical protein